MPIPSVPCNLYATTVLQYTSKFDVKFAVQCQQLHRQHPDSKYVAVILHYAKEFAVKHSDVTLNISVDDKAIIPIGEPDCLNSFGVRAQSIIGCWQFIPANEGIGSRFPLSWIVPLVAFFLTFPRSPETHSTKVPSL